MFPTNKKTTALYLLILGGIIAVVYFLQKSKKITIPFDRAFSILPDKNILQHATSIDRIIKILADSRLERKSTYAQPTEEALKLADSMNQLSNQDLAAVGNYWMAKNGDVLSQFIDNFLDESGRLIELTYRLRELKIYNY